MSALAHGVAAAGARHKMRAAKEGLLEPLLASTTIDSDDESEDESVDENVEIQKQGPLARLKTTAIYGILCAGVVASALAFVLSPQTLVYVAGGICMANIPYSAYKEYNLSRIPTLRSLNNALRADANRLVEEVDLLSAEIDALEPEADRAKGVEEQLNAIASEQHFNVDRLVELVKENGEIIEAMKDNLRQQVVQDIIRIVVDSDKNCDMRFNKVETKMMALRIRMALQEYNVDFDEAMFFQFVSANPCVKRIVSMVQMLIPKIVSISEENESEEDEEEVEELRAWSEMFIVSNEDDSVWSGGSGNRRESLMVAPTRRDTQRLPAPRLGDEAHRSFQVSKLEGLEAMNEEMDDSEEE